MKVFLHRDGSMTTVQIMCFDGACQAHDTPPPAFGPGVELCESCDGPCITEDLRILITLVGEDSRTAQWMAVSLKTPVVTYGG